MKFEDGIFQLGENQDDRIESIISYVPFGNNGLVQEGYSEIFHENGHKKLEAIYSRSHGDRYINQWDSNLNQILESGNGFYIKLDIGMNGLDSIVYEVRDSLFHGESVRYEKNDTGGYYVKEIKNFVKGKEKETSDNK